MNTDGDTNIRAIYKCFKMHPRCKHNMHAFRFYLCNWISGSIRMKNLYTTRAVYKKVRTCWHCTRSAEWFSECVLRMKLDLGQSLPLCLCKLLSADQTVASAIPPSISAMATFDTSSWAALEPAFKKHIKSDQAASMSAFCWCFLWLVWIDVLLMLLSFLSFVFEDQMIDEKNIKKNIEVKRFWVERNGLKNGSKKRPQGQDAQVAWDAAYALCNLLPLLQGDPDLTGLVPEPVAKALLGALRRHPKAEMVQYVGCDALRRLCQNFPSIRTALQRDPSVLARVRAAAKADPDLEKRDWYTEELCVWLQPPCLVWRGRYRWGVGQDGPVVLTWSHLNSIGLSSHLIVVIVCLDGNFIYTFVASWRLTLVQCDIFPGHVFKQQIPLNFHLVTLEPNMISTSFWSLGQFGGVLT